jgi:hypothetical protein
VAEIVIPNCHNSLDYDSGRSIINLINSTHLKALFMSVFKKQIVIASCPAFETVSRQSDRDGFINITAGEKLHFGNSLYTVNSAASCALENNECPVAGYKREKSLGFPTHWLSQDATVISRCANEKGTAVLAELDTKYRFEGKIFTISKANNNNLSLDEVVESQK